MSSKMLSWRLVCLWFGSASQLLAEMDTDEARAVRLVEELCEIPVENLGGVVCLDGDLDKIRDDDGSRVTKTKTVSLFECSDMKFLALIT